MPDSTYPGTENIHSGHFVTVNMSNTSGEKLLISIPGTTGPGDVMKSFDSVAALEGPGEGWNNFLDHEQITYTS